MTEPDSARTTAQRLFTSIVARIRAISDENRASILDERALAEAAELRAAATTGDGELPLEVVRVLAWLHWSRYQTLPADQDRADLRAALELFDRLLQAEPQAVPKLARQHLVGRSSAARRAHVATLLVAHHQHVNEPSGLTEAIDLLADAVQGMADDDPNRLPCLSNLGSALQMRYERGGDAADLDRAVEVGELAVDTERGDEPRHIARLSNLANALRLRYSRDGNLDDLERAVDATRHVVAMSADDQPLFATYLSNLGITLLARFEDAADAADLDEAAQVVMRAIAVTPAGHPSRAMYLANLGLILTALHGSTDEADDMVRAVAAVEEAVSATPPAHPDRLRRLAILVDMLRTGGDRDRFAAVLQQAVEASADDSADRGDYLGELSDVLRGRYASTGNVADLDQAVALARRAAAIPADPRRHAGHLMSLGNGLVERHSRTGNSADIDDAIGYFQQATSNIPAGDPAFVSCLSNLSNALRLRYERTGIRTGNVTDLIWAVANGWQALAALDMVEGGETETVLGLRSNLAAALVFRHHATGSTTDLDEAIDQLGQALRDAPADYPYRQLYQSNLAIALRSRYGVSGDLADLHRAVELLRIVVDNVPAGHSNRTTYLSNLATTLHMRHRRTGGAMDLDESLELWSLATNSTAAPAEVRCRAAYDAARAVAQARGPSHALPHYQAAVDLLPLLAWRGIAADNQRDQLSRHGSSLAADTGAAALTAGEPSTAVEALEHGRGVLWGQLLDTRTDVTALERAVPELAARLAECRTRLDELESTRPISLPATA